MLTERLAGILRGILNHEPEQNCCTVKMWVPPSAKLGYQSDPNADPDQDLEDLSRWGLLQTKDNFYSATVTSLGKMALNRYDILRVIRDESWPFEDNKFDNHFISEFLPNLDISEINVELQTMRKERVIKGKFEPSSGFKRRSGWRDVDLDDLAKVALKNPGRYWDMRSNSEPNIYAPNYGNIANQQISGQDNEAKSENFTQNLGQAISPQILSEIINCLNSLRDSISNVPESHRESYEMAVEDLSDVATSSNKIEPKKVRFRYANLGKILLSIPVLGISALSITADYLSLGQFLNQAGYEVEIMQIPPAKSENLEAN